MLSRLSKASCRVTSVSLSQRVLQMNRCSMMSSAAPDEQKELNSGIINSSKRVVKTFNLIRFMTFPTSYASLLLNKSVNQIRE